MTSGGRIQRVGDGNFASRHEPYLCWTLTLKGYNGPKTCRAHAKIWKGRTWSLQNHAEPCPASFGIPEPRNRSLKNVWTQSDSYVSCSGSRSRTDRRGGRRYLAESPPGKFRVVLELRNTVSIPSSEGSDQCLPLMMHG